jgi:hypothetical protein
MLQCKEQDHISYYALETVNYLGSQNNQHKLK